jgi:hypothetical protein
MTHWERLFAGAFGAVLLGIGLYAVFLGPASPGWRYLGGGAFCAVGLNALYCVLTGKRPWILRIGPSP